MGINMAKAAEIQKNFEAGSGAKGMLQQKQLERTNDIRILPPKPNMNEMYFIKVWVWWFGNKKYVSPKTWGKPCPIEEEVNDAIEKVNKNSTKYAELDSLMSAKGGPKEKEEYLMPVLHLDCEFDKSKPKKVTVIGAKILEAGKALAAAIHDVVTDRNTQNDTEDGIADRVEGTCIMLTKKGTGIDTEYGAKPWNSPYEMDEEHYDDDKIPDVVAHVKKQCVSDAKLRAAIRNYLYGESLDVAEEPSSKTKGRDRDEDDDDRSAKKLDKAPAKKEAVKAAPKKARDEEEEEDEDRAPAKSKSKGRDEEEEEDDDRRPAKKSVKEPERTTKKRSLQDDLEDD